MNKNLNDAMFELGKAEALMYSIESLYFDFDFLPEEKAKADRGAYTFYAAHEALKKAMNSMENYCAECRIVSVIEAVRRPVNEP